ncbi:MAG: AAA family ATPase [Desulfobacteraceae bacterium]
MYKEYFGFSESPFENNLDQRFLFLTPDHKEILAGLQYFVKYRKGLAIVCGDVGTGKTMLLTSFLNRLPESVRAIVIPNPLANYLDLLHFIAKEIGITEKPENILELVGQIKDRLIAARTQGRDYILVVDEAHLLPDDSLEQVRLLSNIEVPESKLLQILLIGQHELSYKLSRPELRQLRQRINVNRFLSPLSPTETTAYVYHRLQVVGSSSPAIFEPHCWKLLYQLTEGVPRRINQLCDNALLSCMTEGLKRVNPQILKKSHRALLTDVLFTPHPGHKYFKVWKNPRLLVPLAGGLAFLIMGLTLSHTSWYEHYRLGNTSGSALSSISLPLPAQPEARENQRQALSQSDRKARPPASSAPSPKSVRKLAVLSPEDQKKSAAPDSKGEAQVVLSNSRSSTKRLHKVVEVKPNDTLLKIASTYFPGNVDLGLEAILLANPETINEDLIYTGQRLDIPSVNPAEQTIVLKENLFYAAHGRYLSIAGLQETLSRLGQQGVRYLVVNTKNNRGGVTHRVLIGGYENREDLNNALERIKANSG